MIPKRQQSRRIDASRGLARTKQWSDKLWIGIKFQTSTPFRSEAPASNLSPGSVALVGVAYLRRSGWTPSIVPKGDDQNVYRVIDDFGRNRRVYREPDVETTDLETVITDR